MTMTCRRCSECLGADHHWTEGGLSPVPETCEHAELTGAREPCDDCLQLYWTTEPDFVCKHCDATAMLCGECDGLLGGGCEACGGSGIQPGGAVH